MGNAETLEQALARQSARNRALGAEYRSAGRVKLLERTPRIVRAAVRGSERYRVQLALVRGRWSNSCTCPAFDQYSACKHICAVLLEVTLSRKSTVTRVEHDGELENDDGHEDDTMGDGWKRDDLRGVESELEILDRLLTDPRMSDNARKKLLAELARGAIFVTKTPATDSEHQRRQRVLTALDTFAPARQSPQVRSRLRYVLTPREPSAKTVGIQVQAARIDAKGQLGPYRAQYVPLHDTDLDETDRLASAVLLEGPRDPSTTYFHATRTAELPLQPALQRLLLPRLALEDRLWFTPNSHQDPDPVVFDAGDPWHFGLEVDSNEKELVLAGALRRADDLLPLSEVVCVLGGGFAIARGALRTVDWHGAHQWAAHLAGGAPVRLGRERASDVTRILSRAPMSMPVRAEGLVEDVRGEPRPTLTLLPPSDQKGDLDARILFDYGGERVRRSASAVTIKGDRVLRIHRDAEAEARYEAQFFDSGGKPAPRTRDVDGVVAQKQLAPIVIALSEQGWIVEGEGVRLRTGAEIDISVRSGIDWFDVETDVSFGDAHVELPALLEALAQKRQLVRLSDGSLGVLPEQWLRKWGALAELGELEDGVLRVKKTRGFLLDVLLAEKADARVDAGFRELRERFARAREPKVMRESKEFVGELRPYQREGLGWLAFLGEAGLGGCLADDMGLGKTIQVLAHVLRRKKTARGPTLVVAPMSLLFNWQSEAGRFAPKLAVVLHHGASRAEKPAALEDADLVVTTYGTLLRDVKMLAEVHFDLVVLDEAQAIKNPRSQSAKAARLLEADQRLALTGTPIENRIGDLLSIFEFLNPGMLEGSRALRGLLEGSNEVETVRLAARALGPFLLRRTKEAVLKDLPAKVEQVVTVELEGTQRREYDALKEHYRRTLLAKVDEVGMEKAGMNVLEALLRLRQAACHLALVDSDHAKTKSAKLEALMERLDELRESGHKALVFSQFTSLLAFVKKELDDRGVTYEYLDGETRDRKERVERFQADATKTVFLISLKAGGVGLNLTAADYVFLLDPWWNPAVERQAIDRTHRIGQTRSVTAYRMVARDTVEEKVLALQDKKRALAAALFEGQGGGLKGMTREDLAAILA